MKDARSSIKTAVASGILAVVLLGVPETLSAQVERVFRSPIPFPAPSAPTSLFLGDLDRNGLLDAATAHLWSGTISVFLDDPERIFERPANYRVGQTPIALLGGDMDGDSAIDLVSLDSSLSSFLVLLNRGDGTFRTAREFLVGYDPSSIALADLDADGNLDVAVSINGCSCINLLFGDGSGGFRSGRVIEGLESPHSLQVDDFDADGLPDIAVALRQAPWRVAIFRNQGGGRFLEAGGATPDALRDWRPLALATGRFDADELPDIALLTGDLKIFLLRNLGAGDFETSAVGATDDSWSRYVPGFLQAMDLDGDGKLDLISRLEVFGVQGLRVYSGKGNGEFHFGSLFLGSALELIAFGDLTGDGVLDALVGRSSGLVLVRGLEPGRFDTQSTIWMGDSPRRMLALDVDGDGDQDLLSCNSNSFSVLKNHGKAQISHHTFDSVPGAMLEDMASGDFDGNGRQEIAMAGSGVDRVILAFLDPRTRVDRFTSIPVQDQPVGLAAADFDFSGIADIAVAHMGSPNVLVLLDPLVGDVPETVTIPVGSSQRAVGAADLDLDGDQDLVVSAGDRILIFKGDGRGSFSQFQELAGLRSPDVIRFADLDRDGLLDPLVLDRNRILILSIGRGGVDVREILLAYEGKDFQVADIDGDDRLDLATLNSTYGEVFVYRDLDRLHQSLERYRVISPLSALLLADLDGEGFPDCAIAHSNLISILRGSAVEKLPEFLRGDGDGNRVVEITDVVGIFERLFLGEAAPACPDAMDVDDSGHIDITDAVALLLYLFGGEAPPPPPGPDSCGPDPTPDPLAECLQSGCR